jgi:A/G-specific adenine glycosylase
MIHFLIVNEPRTTQFPSTALLNWYQEHSRDLPWRENRDPYRVWVSEIMLQQTRVDTVIDYFLRFMDAYPTVEKLATTQQDQLLKLWEGLGYYSRALNLHRTAKLIAEQYKGNFPQDPKELESLPGIGPYTAGAIASIAFDQPAPIVDGNLRRLFTRWYGIDTPIQSSQTEKVLWTIAKDLVPEKNPGDFNQALMELGALVCTPKNPQCKICPIDQGCFAKKAGMQDQLPRRKKKPPLPHYQVTAAVIRKGDQVLLAKRPQEGLLGGLWEFPGGKQESGESLKEALVREIQEELAGEIEIGDLIGVYQHAYTHYKITLHAYQCRMISDRIELLYHTEISWSDLDALSDFPMGKLDRQIANQLRKIRD